MSRDGVYHVPRLDPKNEASARIAAKNQDRAPQLPTCRF